MEKKQFRVYLYTRPSKEDCHGFAKLRAQVIVGNRCLYISFPVMVGEFKLRYKTNGEFKKGWDDPEKNTIEKFTDKAVKSAYLACTRVMEYVCTLPPQYAQLMPSRHLESLVLDEFVLLWNGSNISAIKSIAPIYNWHEDLKKWEGER